jgi:hypothetical protein
MSSENILERLSIKALLLILILSLCHLYSTHRPAEDRNEMEKLTFASLAHLPTAVIFVIDPTGLSGEKSTLLAQLNVRKHLKERFPKRPWLDVVSKGTCECVCVCAGGGECERAGVYVRACVRVCCIVCFHPDMI